jgi:tRNA(Met) cytidine acetyltransferase
MRVLSAWNGEKIPVEDGWEATLNNDDWLELAGFAFAHRAFSTSVAADAAVVNRGYAASGPARENGGKTEDVGRKALLATLRMKPRKRLKALIIRAASS